MNSGCIYLIPCVITVHITVTVNKGDWRGTGLNEHALLTQLVPHKSKEINARLRIVASVVQMKPGS